MKIFSNRLSFIQSGFILMLAAIQLPAIAQEIKIQEASKDAGYRYCIDQKNSRTCIDGIEVIKKIYPSSRKLKQGFSTNQKNHFISNVAAYKFSTGYDRYFLLYAIEEFEIDANNERPSCHACSPQMHLMLLASRNQERWQVISSQQGINDMGSWGSLFLTGSKEDALHIYNGGNDNFIFVMGAGYTNQGQTESVNILFANYDAQGKKMHTFAELGRIEASSSSCSGFDENALGFETQLIFDYSSAGYPKIHAFKTEYNECKNIQPVKTLPQITYQFSASKKTYLPK